MIGKTPDESPWPGLTMPLAWDLFTSALELIGDDLNAPVTTQSFSLMNNHYHWLVDLGGELDEGQEEATFQWFHELLRCESLSLGVEDPYQLLGQTPSFYQIQHIKQYQATYKYIYRNPVEAGLVMKPEDYPFSTLPFVLGRKELGFTCMDQMNLIYSPAQLLKWLNQPEP